MKSRVEMQKAPLSPQSSSADELSSARHHRSSSAFGFPPGLGSSRTERRKSRRARRARKLLQLQTVNFLGKILVSLSLRPIAEPVRYRDSRVPSIRGHATSVNHSAADGSPSHSSFAVDFQNGYMIVLEKLSSTRAGAEALGALSVSLSSRKHIRRRRGQQQHEMFFTFFFFEET
jgi:hypothetical protein